jgi:putative phage-type endonuclease
MIEQRSPDWYAQRLGKATASRISDVMAKTKNGPAELRKTYRRQLITERVYGVPAFNYVNGAMQWGIDHEAEALAAYAEDLERLDPLAGPVMPAEFVDHPEILWSGASPDGLVGDDGLVEIKCPESATHVETILGAPISERHALQMQWQMACTGRAWCDYVSFDPRAPDPALRLHVRRVERDVSRILDLEVEVAAFLDEIAEAVERARTWRREAAA